MLYTLLNVSPATGEEIEIAPFIFGGVALALVVAMVVMTLMGKKKKTDSNDAATDTPSDPSDEQ